MYIVAKKIDKVGCIASEVESGERIGALIEYLSLTMLDKGIEIVVLDKPNMYGEYAPYEFLSEVEFVCSVLSMSH
ncbi:TPA: hypothetical protein KNH77_003813 [Clostridioides difficile]|uniref:Uncharacterized protein n=1 Tax=Clostridioides difficile TaxID=1496 RepID=A0AB74QHJ1_CLODI|nr:DUF6718 family protein [Clostridioides difficile]EIS9447431.1 hypothetical protein [Clostridioides difficile]EIS9595058.1 hypothetical protein [Clostridioides difficile]ELX4591873.1 hypothetical protein [Clostridioides difficile]MBH6835586.1 hypothetical protein [Clostridioides difficile]MBZ0834557.1 hypothetical protein [Clostridioides difficile]